jgi:hypothetical protein
MSDFDDEIEQLDDGYKLKGVLKCPVSIVKSSKEFQDIYYLLIEGVQVIALTKLELPTLLEKMEVKQKESE